VLFKILFFLLFLLGVSLFLSTVATIILKKKSRSVVKGTQPKRDISKEAIEKVRDNQQRYLDRVSEENRSLRVENVKKGEEQKLEQISTPEFKRTVELGKIKWVFITFLIIIIIFSGAFFWIKSYRSRAQVPKLYLCEAVDFIKLKPIKSSVSFTRGNVTVFFKSKAPIKPKLLSLDIYKLGDAGFVPYAKIKIGTKSGCTSFIATVLSDQLGNYIIEIKDPNGKIVTQKLIEIVPDSYAYKAKLRVVH